MGLETALIILLSLKNITYPGYPPVLIYFYCTCVAISAAWEKLLLEGAIAKEVEKVLARIDG